MGSRNWDLNQSCDEGLGDSWCCGHVYGYYWWTWQKPSSPREHPGVMSPCRCLTHMSLWLFTGVWFWKTKCETIRDDLDLILTWSSWYFVLISTIKCKAPSYVRLADFLVGRVQPETQFPWQVGLLQLIRLCAVLSSPVGISGGYVGLARSLGWLMPPHCSLDLSQLRLFCACTAGSSQIAPLHNVGSLLVQQKEQCFCIPSPVSCSTWVFLGDLLFAHGASPASRGWRERRAPQWGCEPEIPQPHLTHLRPGGLLPLCNCELPLNQCFNTSKAALAFLRPCVIFFCP